MPCFKPCEVIILPTTGGADDFQSKNSPRDDGEGVNLLYSVEDVLRHYLPETQAWQRDFDAFPFVVWVPEGEEQERASRYRMQENVRVAIPNFYINPLQTSLTPTINKVLLRGIADQLHYEVKSPQCGLDVKIAVIDTGVDGSVLPYPNRLHPKQYDANAPFTTGTLSPYDPVGHGSTVAYLINEIAPAASLFSIKMMEEVGTVGSLLCALYLAEADFAPDIYNLSLGVVGDLDLCGSCGSPLGSEAAVNAAQLQLLFELLETRAATSSKAALMGIPNGIAEKPLMVAAAGNNSRNLLMPASFPNVLAVGSCDLTGSARSPYSNYNSVPPDRFILAPGGLAELTGCISHTTPWGRHNLLFGTSFSAAFVTGIAARYLCATKPSPCGRSRHDGPLATVRDFMMECLAECARGDFPGYSPEQHGLGIADYNVAYVRERTFSAVAPSASRLRVTLSCASVLPGQDLYLVGDIPQLGDWNPQCAIRMNPVSDSTWKITIDSLNQGQQIEFKFIQMDQFGSVTWEATPNRTLTVPPRSWSSYLGFWQQSP